MAAATPAYSRAIGATGTGVGHAKLILIGEHWVLDGATALAVGLPTLATVCSVTAGGAAGPQASLAADAAFNATELATAAAMAQLACSQVGMSGGQFVTSAGVPVRRGLGSSAALAVALVRAAAAAAGDAAPAEVLLARATALEALVHGRSSGVDPAAASAGGGAVLFREGKVIERLARISPRLAEGRWVLADLGRGQPTREAINRAAAARAGLAPAIHADWLARVTAASHRGMAALAAGSLSELAAAMREASAALAPLDIVTAEMRVAIQLLCRNGALAAKSTGAGLGGVVVALVADAAAATALCAACREQLTNTTVLSIATPREAIHD